MFTDTAFDDFMKRFSNVGMEDDLTREMQKNTNSVKANKIQNKMEKAEKLGGLVDLAKGFTTEASAPSVGFAQRYDYDPEMQSQYLAMEGVKDTVAQQIPLAGAFRAVEKMSKEIGNAVGGEEAGDAIGSIVDPLSTQMELMKNEEATAGERILGLTPVFGGLAAANARNRLQYKNQKKANIKESEFEKRKLEEQYRMEEGLQSMENLKALRKKQLGML